MRGAGANVWHGPGIPVLPTPGGAASISVADTAGAAEAFSGAPGFLAATGLTTGSGTSRTATVSTATAAGDTLLALVSSQATACTISALTDSKGNVYTLDRSIASVPLMYCFRSPGATGGPGGGQTAALTTSDTVTATSAAQTGNVEVQLISVPGVGAVDQISALASGTTATPTVSATPTADGETCVVLMVNNNTGGAPVINSPFGLISTYHTGVNVYNTAASEQLGSGTSGSAQTFTATITAIAWNAVMYTFAVPSTPIAQADAAGAAESFSVSVTVPLADRAAAVEPATTPVIAAAVPLPDPDEAGAVEQFAGTPPSLALPRCHLSAQSGNTTPVTSVSPSFNSMTNSGQGISGTTPSVGDLVVIILTAHLSNTTFSQTSDTQNAWTFVSTGDNNGGAVGNSTVCAYRWWTGGEAASAGITFTLSQSARTCYSIIALAPTTAGQYMVADAVVGMVKDNGGTSHPVPVATASGSGELSVVLVGASGTSSPGATAISITTGNAWNILASRNNIGDGSSPGALGSTFSTAVGYCPGQAAGTVDPGTWTIEGNTSATGPTNINFYHLVISATVVPQVMLTNSFEGGTAAGGHGTAITPANSAPGPLGMDEALDNVYSPATGSSITFDQLAAAFGQYSANLVTGSTAGNAFLEWGASLGGPAANAQLWFRFYYYMASLPGGNTRIFQLSQQQSGGAGGLFLRITSAGKWVVVDCSGTVVYTSTATCPTGTWFRFEGWVKGDPSNGGIIITQYPTASQTAVGETFSASTGQSTGGAMGFVEYGWAVNQGSLNVAIDEIAVSNYGPPGSLVPGYGDHGAARDALAVAMAVPEADIAAAADSLSVTAATNITVADAAAGTESLAVVVSVPLAEQAAALDNVYVATEFTLVNNAAGGTPGVATTAGAGGNTGGLSGNYFDVTQAGTGTTNQFDNTNLVPGEQVAYELAIGATTAQSYLQWSSSMFAVPVIYVRFMLYVTAVPASNRRIFSAQAPGSLIACGIQVTSAGRLQIIDQGSSGVGASSALIPLNQWVRVEMLAVAGTTTGFAFLQMFSNPADTAPASTTSTANQNFRATTFVQLIYGCAAGGVSSWGPYWYADIGGSNDGWMGPPSFGPDDAAAAAESLSVPAITTALPEAAGAAEALSVSVSVPEADRAAATDAVAVTLAPIALPDVAAGAEASTATVTLPLADTAGAADTLAVPAEGIALAEVAGAAEAFAVSAAGAPVLADTAAAIEAITATVTLPLADTAGGADTSVISAKTLPVADSAGAAEALAAAATVPVADAAAAAEVLAAAAAVPLPDQAAAAEAAIATVTLPLPDSGAGAEAFSTVQGSQVPLADAAAGADVLAVTAATPLGEVAGAADVLQPTASVSLTERGAGAEAISVAVNVAVALPDTAAAADQLTGAVLPLLPDAAGAAEALSVAVTGIAYADSAGAAEAFSMLQGTLVYFTDFGAATGEESGQILVPEPVSPTAPFGGTWDTSVTYAGHGVLHYAGYAYNTGPPYPGTPVAPGTTYHLQVAMQPVPGDPSSNATAQIQWLDAGSNAISTISNTMPGGLTGWQIIDVWGVAPASARFCYVQFWYGPVDTTTRWYVGQVTLSAFAGFGVAAAVPLPEAGTGLDAAALVAHETDTDTLTGTDAQALRITLAPPSQETVTAAETTAISATLHDMDAGTGTDNDGSVPGRPRDYDTGHFEDSEIRPVTAATEAVVAVEAATIALSDGDTGTAAEAAAFAGQVFISDSDAFSAMDAGTGQGDRQDSDSGSFTDASAATFPAHDSDTVTADDELAELVVFTFWPATLQPLAGQLMAVVWQPGTPQETVLMTGRLDKAMLTFATMLHEHAAAGGTLARVTDSDTGSFTETGTLSATLEVRGWLGAGGTQVVGRARAWDGSQWVTPELALHGPGNGAERAETSDRHPRLGFVLVTAAARPGRWEVIAVAFGLKAAYALVVQHAPNPISLT